MPYLYFKAYIGVVINSTLSWAPLHQTGRRSKVVSLTQGTLSGTKLFMVFDLHTVSSDAKVCRRYNYGRSFSQMYRCKDANMRTDRSSWKENGCKFCRSHLLYAQNFHEFYEASSNGENTVLARDRNLVIIFGNHIPCSVDIYNACIFQHYLSEWCCSF